MIEVEGTALILGRVVLYPVKDEVARDGASIRGSSPSSGG